ncbi:MAG: molybdenum cofactor guanylyltransferase MobA [bacterium]
MPDDESKTTPIALSAVVLAGGRATRMGGDDKGLILFRGEPLAARIRDALATQAAEVLINANRNLAAYRRLGCAVVTDRLADHQGPLAGMHAALAAAAHPWLLTIPCDGPFVRADYAATLLAAAEREGVRLAVAHDGARAQPVHSLIHRDLADSLEQFLHSGERKIDRWHAQHRFALADFSTDPLMFTNINTREQLAELERSATR